MVKCSEKFRMIQGLEKGNIFGHVGFLKKNPYETHIGLLLKGVFIFLVVIHPVLVGLQRNYCLLLFW